MVGNERLVTQCQRDILKLGQCNSIDMSYVLPSLSPIISFLATYLSAVTKKEKRPSLKVRSALIENTRTPSGGKMQHVPKCYISKMCFYATAFIICVCSKNHASFSQPVISYKAETRYLQFKSSSEIY